tara:strand:+ start:90 stop:239 length:150 start_codon:yes stop_codon:yes gene_type:complete
MALPTEDKKKRIKELREDTCHINDPFILLSETLYENERLREKLARLAER